MDLSDFPLYSLAFLFGDACHRYDLLIFHWYLLFFFMEKSDLSMDCAISTIDSTVFSLVFSYHRYGKMIVRLLFDCSSAVLRHCFDIASGLVRDCFETASGVVRELFECCSSRLRLLFDWESKPTRRVVEAPPNKGIGRRDYVPKQPASESDLLPKPTAIFRNKMTFYNLSLEQAVPFSLISYEYVSLLHVFLGKSLF